MSSRSWIPPSIRRSTFSKNPVTKLRTPSSTLTVQVPRGSSPQNALLENFQSERATPTSLGSDSTLTVPDGETSSTR